MSAPMSQKEMDRLVRRADMEAHGGMSVAAEVVGCSLLMLAALLWLAIRWML